MVSCVLHVEYWSHTKCGKAYVRFFQQVALTACHPGFSLTLHPFVLYRLVGLGEPAGTFIAGAIAAGA